MGGLRVGGGGGGEAGVDEQDGVTPLCMQGDGCCLACSGAAEWAGTRRRRGDVQESCGAAAAALPLNRHFSGYLYTEKLFSKEFVPRGTCSIVKQIFPKTRPSGQSGKKNSQLPVSMRPLGCTAA